MSGTEDQQRKPDYWNLKEAISYFFRKKDPASRGNINLKIMHGINRLAIVIFLLGVIYLIIKYIVQ